jgi:hypothetical protein
LGSFGLRQSPDRRGSSIRVRGAADPAAIAERRASVTGFQQPKEREHTLMPRELIDTGTDKRFVRRNGQGQFKESDDVGRSLASDRRQHAKNKSNKGEGDRGDR